MNLMILKKIEKHSLILQRRIGQEKELKNMSSYKNPLLKVVVDSFLKVKESRFSRADEKAFKACEAYRNKLLQDDTLITYEIFGLDKTALVKDICKHAASSEKWCQFLYFIAKETDEPAILEIGTNLGVSGSYTLEAIKDKTGSKFITMEGLPQLCEISSKQFSSIVSPDKFEVLQGLYDFTFPILLKKDIKFNLLFIDGNHQKDPTLEYFEELKKKVASSAIFIFDDINWSEGMKEAWDIIKKDNNVNYSIDLYEQGIVIIDKEDPVKNINFQLHLAY
ncbi:O-methyltransferase [Pontibacter locisalis]|uniref:O-methyltransferase n=1 Tax=Pontibacter locisalis TaxID=1719035 RepID=A0ABW5IQD6_9BACT